MESRLSASPSSRLQRVSQEEGWSSAFSSVGLKQALGLIVGQGGQTEAG